jgi:hypothetical protein
LTPKPGIKIIVLVLTAPYSPWHELFRKGSQQTWISESISVSNVEIFSYQGIPANNAFGMLWNRFLFSRFGHRFWSNNSNLELPTRLRNHHEIEVKVAERWDTMYTKFYSTLNFICNNYEFDYIIRINTTTYLNLRNLISEIHRVSNYGGVRIKDEDVAAGWGIVLSKQAVKDLLDFDYRFYEMRGRFEDGIIGHLMKIHGYKFTELSNLNLEKTLLQDVPDSEFEQAVFIRCKQTVLGVREDDRLMREIHERLRHLGIDS